LQLLSAALHEGIEERFREVLSAKSYAGDDVDAGRRYVARYVDLIHYAEHAYDLISATPVQRQGAISEHEGH
jgi:hypothetical protein